MNKTQEIIVKRGVKALRDYGYPECDKDNIFTDEIYGAFFKSILEDNLGKGHDEDIQALIDKIGKTP